VDGIHAARRFVQRTLAERLRDPLLTAYETLQNALSLTPSLLTNKEEEGIDAAAIGQRALKNICLDYLMQLDEPELRIRCVEQFHNASNMTDQLGALAPLINSHGPEGSKALAAFYDHWQHEALVVDKTRSIGGGQVVDFTGNILPAWHFKRGPETHGARNLQPPQS